MRRLLPLISAFALTACGGGPALEIGDAPAELQPIEGPELAVQTRWAAELARTGRHYLQLRPVADGDRVYAVDHEGTLQAFTATRGDELWQTRVAERVSGGLGDGGELLLMGGDAEVVAVAKADGAVQWRAEVSSEVLARPVRSDELVVVRTIDGGVFGLAAGDGSRRWEYHQEAPLLTLRGNSAPAVAEGTVVIGGDNGRLVALDRQSGEVRWEQAVTVPRGQTELERMADVDGRIAIRDHVVYASSYQGRLVAVALDDGQILWTRELASHTGVTAAGKNLYTVDDQGDLWALSRRNGASLWRQKALHGRRLSTPVVQGDYLVVGDLAGYLHWLDRADGHLVARVRIQDRAEFFPLGDPEEGAEENPYPVNRAVLAAPVVEGERVYVLDQRGVLNAVRSRPQSR